MAYWILSVGIFVNGILASSFGKQGLKVQQYACFVSCDVYIAAMIVVWALR